MTISSNPIPTGPTPTHDHAPSRGDEVANKTYRIQLFGAEAAACGKRQVVLTDSRPTLSLAQLRDLLAAAEPSLVRLLSKARFAVNHEFAPCDSIQLQSDDEIALIGMVSGG